MPVRVTWLSVNFILFIPLIISFTVFPVLFVTGPEPLVLIILAIIVLVPVVVFFARARQYYTGRWYEIREGEISGKRGFWFETTGVVPDNRITNLDVKQGPVMRVLMDFHVCHPDSRLFRPGRPGDTGFEGMEHAGELCELIRPLVRHAGTSGNGNGGALARVTGEPITTDRKILQELGRIRQLLEMKRK